MNRHSLRALALDAWYQVLDNWVFRILAVLTLVPILFSFVLGFREDGIVLLFGLRTWDYAGLLELFGPAAAAGLRDGQGLVIQILLGLVFEFLAGSLGMLFCIAATAFFVPRMLEKGAAELLFHRPLPRWSVYLSRYAAGLLFIGLTSTLLVVGMYLGLLCASRHNDPGILVAALTLTYVFGLVYSFTMLVGVVTRSTVASILLSALFFMGNGCVHNGWILHQQRLAGKILVPGRESVSEARDESPDDPESEPDATADTGGGFGDWFFGALDLLHLVLPKTTDADHLGKKLRAAVEAPLLREEESLVAIYRAPDGVRLLTRGEDEPAVPQAPLAPELRSALGERRALLRREEPPAPGLEYSLWRRSAEQIPSRSGRVRRETTSQAAQRLEDALRASVPAAEPSRASVPFGFHASGNEVNASVLRWNEAGRSRELVLFKGLDPETFYCVLVDAEGELGAEELDALRDKLGARMGIDHQAADSWYARQLSFHAPWRFNLLFSIGSSLAFALCLLALGAWRLQRMSF